jgi:PAS domain S-box-containing protein
MVFSTDLIRVLHVDDEPGFAEMAAEFIQRQDERFDIETATSVDEALDRFRENQIHCIVSDFDMPGRNGIEFLEAVREQHPDLPFILFTGKGSEEIAGDAISAGVTDYLQKETGAGQYAILAQRISNAVNAVRAENELQETLSRVTDAIYTVDTDWRITYVNEGTEEIMGPKEELLGEILWEQFPEAAEGVIWEKFHEAMETQSPKSFEVFYEPLDLWAAATAYPSSTGITVYFQDITEQKEREREYKLTIEFLQKLYDTATATELDPDEKITRILEVGPETVGLPPGYLTRIDVPENGQSDGTQRVIKASGNHDLLQPGNSCPLSESYCRKTIVMDGIMEVHDARKEGWEGDPAFELFNLGCYIGTSITVNNEVYGTVFFAREQPEEAPFTGPERTFVQLLSQLVSYELERQETEGDLQLAHERMEFALDATDSIIYAVDLETEESTDYGPVERVLGIEPAGMPDYLNRGVHPDDRHEVEQVFDAIRQGDSEVFDVEFRTAPNLDGTEWVSSTGFVQERTDQAARQLIGLATDITERKQRETELTRQNERLDEFASIVSHDLRNPLNVAEGRLELAREDCASEHLDAIDGALGRMDALIENMLELARLGQQVSEREPVDLAELAQACWRNVDSGDASLVTTDAPSILGDRVRLQQLLENLIRNAVDHGGERVTMTIGAIDDGFYVEDDGVGIPENDRDEIFESGYSSTEGGTGFGLSIVKQIAEAHGWTVEILTGADGGARFEFTGVSPG